MTKPWTLVVLAERFPARMGCDGRIIPKLSSSTKVGYIRGSPLRKRLRPLYLRTGCNWAIGFTCFCTKRKHRPLTGAKRNDCNSCHDIEQIFMRVKVCSLASSMEPVDRTQCASFQLPVGIFPTPVSRFWTGSSPSVSPPGRKRGNRIFHRKEF